MLAQVTAGARMHGSMQRTFQLQAPGKDDARVRDKIRQAVNNYVRRESRRTPPAGCRGWDFVCRVGPTADSAQPRPLKEVGGAIDAAALAGATQVFVEIVAKAAVRPGSA